MLVSRQSAPDNQVSTGTIRKLDEATVNRIAAGEVVQRPSAAVKEMIENSLDAKSTSISIIVKDGGLQSLQIQDNGSGIHKDDLAICCERFTTSKLTNFNDLKTVATFGFRGEALASITHVARVSIVTRTSSDPCAYKAKYSDGRLVAHKPGEVAEAKPCAGVQGTTILVEDLFYNMPTRKTTFKNANEEYQRIHDVVMKYSIHYGDKGIAFSCKKQGGGAASDIHTPLKSNTLANIKYFYGAVLARELLHVELEIDEQAVGDPVRSGSGSGSGDNCSSNSAGCAMEEDLFAPPNASRVDAEGGGDDASSALDTTSVRCSVSGYVSNANYSTKKPTCIVFINHRLVDCVALKRVVESVFAPLLPKHTHPFIYLSLFMPAASIDVNVHPTKREVHFLHEDLILRRLHAYVCERLGNSNESRVFYAQSLIAPSVAAKPRSINSDVVALQTSTPVRGAGAGGNTGMSPVGIDPNVPRSPTVPPSRPIGVGSAADEMELGEDPIEAYDSDPENESVAAVQQDSSSSSSKGRVSGADLGPSKRSASRAPAINPSKLVRVDFRNTQLEQYFSKEPVTLAGTGASSSAATDSGDGDAVASEDKDDSSGGDDADLGLYCGSCISSSASGPGGGRKKRRLLSGGVAVTASAVSGSAPTGVGYLASGRCSCCGVERLDAAGNVAPGAVHAAPSSGAVQSGAKVRELATTTCNYDSIQFLLRQIHDPRGRDSQLEEVMKQHVYVGPVSSPHYCLVQVGTRLLLLDLFGVALEFFYQCAIKQFQCFTSLTLQSPVNVFECIMMVISQPDFDQWGGFVSLRPADDKKSSNLALTVRQEEYAYFLSGVLGSHCELLEEYFCLRLVRDASNSNSSNPNDAKDLLLASIPGLLAGAYFPNGTLLPLFLFELASAAATNTANTDNSTAAGWATEQACFDSIAQCLACYYTNSILQSNPMDSVDSAINCKGENEVEAGGVGAEGRAAAGGSKDTPSEEAGAMNVGTGRANTIKNILLPHLRALYIPTKDFKVLANPGGYFGKQCRLKLGSAAAGSRAIELTRLEQLYKIFERC